MLRSWPRWVAVSRSISSSTGSTTPSIGRCEDVPLLAQKRATLDALAAHGIPATLVATLRRGLNLEQAGDLLRFGLDHPAVRGINFQCEAYFGRNPAAENPPERVTQTEVVGVLARTAGELLETEDFLSLSCGLACLVYLEKTLQDWKPIPRVLAGEWEGNPLTAFRSRISSKRRPTYVCANAEHCSKRSHSGSRETCWTSRWKTVPRYVQERFFHLTVVSFLDGWNFDLNRACRECVHILHPDGRKMPFSAFNTIHRGNRV